jgi:hypothetical protein
MWRLQYRNFGTHETLVGNFVTDVDGTDHGGIRWFELRKTGAGPWTLFQEGTYAPDTAHRWMGSVAMDKDGNIALGYSVSSNTVFPSIRYAGRLASDPPGTLPQGEVSVIEGTFSQTGPTRWGDYSAMVVDPADDCTFWYTNEYVATVSGNWGTRIASFRFPSCAGPSLSIGLNSTSFQPQDTLILSATVTPGATSQNVDAYVAIQLPDSTLLFLTGSGTFTQNAVPFASNFTVTPFSGEIFRYTFNGGEPPGAYRWFAAFAEPGTPNFIGNIVAARFTFRP